MAGLDFHGLQLLCVSDKRSTAFKKKKKTFFLFLICNSLLENSSLISMYLKVN